MIDDVRVVREPLVLATPSDVDRVEARFWFTFPAGYRDLVTRLGEGVLGSFVRVYPPWRVEGELAGWRRRVAKYWFWDEGRDVLPKERALECVIVGDTLNGDEIVFHPTRNDRLFVLPRDSEEVFEAGESLTAAVQWACGSGRLTEPVGDLVFEPFDSRSPEHAAPSDGGAADPEGESLDDLLELGKRWAERHAALKQAKKDLKNQVAGLKKQTGTALTSTLVHEGFAFDGEYPYRSVYLAVFRINDKASRLELGTFHWHLSDGSNGFGFTPNDANLARLRKPE